MRKDELRRRAPRPMASVLANVIADMAPTDPLMRLQAAWPQIAGRKHADHSKPIRIHGDGTFVIRCDSGAMASELQLREPQMKALITDLLGLSGELRFQGPAGRH